MSTAARTSHGTVIDRQRWHLHRDAWPPQFWWGIVPFLPQPASTRDRWALPSRYCTGLSLRACHHSADRRPPVTALSHDPRIWGPYGDVLWSGDRPVPRDIPADGMIGDCSCRKFPRARLLKYGGLPINCGARPKYALTDVPSDGHCSGFTLGASAPDSTAAKPVNKSRAGGDRAANQLQPHEAISSCSQHPSSCVSLGRDGRAIGVNRWWRAIADGGQR